jgi:hypothetical protein
MHILSTHEVYCYSTFYPETERTETSSLNASCGSLCAKDKYSYI